MPLKDIPSFIRTTNPNDIMIDFALFKTERTQKASAIILNTFGSLERQVLDALSSHLSPPVLPLDLYTYLDRTVNNNDFEKNQFNSISRILRKEDHNCLEWLDWKEPNSVVYLNFGSITVMTSEQLVEFAWGLTNSKKAVLSIIRLDLVSGKGAILPLEFTEETKDRGFLASCCLQEQVVPHGSVTVLVALLVELDDREHLRWGFDVMRAILHGAADELPVQL